MALDADSIVDRRRMRRSLAGWRIVAVLAVAGLLAAAVAAFGGFDFAGRSSPHIARLSIDGVIADDRKRIELIEKMATSPAVAGVLVTISSPGGTTSGGESLYEALRLLAQKKPVVAHIGALGTSAGYMVALASDHIVARRTSITGSIGVLIQYGEVSRLLDTLGVSVGIEKSGPLKAEPDPFSPVSPDAKAMLAGVVADSYEWFLSLVVERRKLDEATARRLADGRIFTGHQADEAGLVDELGEESAAIAWLVTDRGLAEGLPVREWKTRQEGGLLSLGSAIGSSFGEGIASSVLSVFGLGGAAGDGRLDGLLSLWQASSEKRGDRFTGATR